MGMEDDDEEDNTTGNNMQERNQANEESVDNDFCITDQTFDEDEESCRTERRSIIKPTTPNKQETIN